jgi:hypothetical protein
MHLPLSRRHYQCAGKGKETLKETPWTAPMPDRITGELFAGPDALAINSCAAEVSYLALLWAGRRTMVDMLVDTGKSLVYRMEPAGSLLSASAQLAG